jgi:two-component system chemotaxis response regulator CheY
MVGAAAQCSSQAARGWQATPPGIPPKLNVGINPLFKPAMIDRPRATTAAGFMQAKARGKTSPAPRDKGSKTLALDPSMSVLVVDDYSTMVRIIRNLLRQLGFTDVDDAADGSAALAKMHAKRYGLVISDWNMEPMTGFELLREVRTDPNLRETPFIMVTAVSKTENVIAARKAGVNNYIVKPFNAQTLKAKIEAVFAGGASG